MIQTILKHLRNESFKLADKKILEIMVVNSKNNFKKFNDYEINSLWSQYQLDFYENLKKEYKISEKKFLRTLKFKN